MSREGPKVEAPKWPRCRAAHGCLGIRVDGDQACLAHVSVEARQAALDALTPGAQVNLQGTAIDSELLGAVLANLRSKDGVPTFGAASFEQAQFKDDSEFKGVLFDGWASFENASFLKCANFDEATFNSGASFKDAHFEGDVSFRKVSISPKPQRGAPFDKAEFKGEAHFDEAQLRSTVWFKKATFAKRAWFTATHFAGNIRFTEANCGNLT